MQQRQIMANPSDIWAAQLPHDLQRAYINKLASLQWGHQLDLTLEQCDAFELKYKNGREEGVHEGHIDLRIVPLPKWSELRDHAETVLGDFIRSNAGMAIDGPLVELNYRGQWREDGSCDFAMTINAYTRVAFYENTRPKDVYVSLYNHHLRVVPRSKHAITCLSSPCNWTARHTAQLKPGSNPSTCQWIPDEAVTYNGLPAPYGGMNPPSNLTAYSSRESTADRLDGLSVAESSAASSGSGDGAGTSTRLTI